MDTAPDTESFDGDGRDEWLPKQAAVLDTIQIPRESRPVYPNDLGENLRGEIERQLDELAATARRLRGGHLWVSKQALGEVRDCEAHHIARRQSKFEWTAATAQGTVLHKAVELLWDPEMSNSNPNNIVDEAVKQIVRDDKSLGPFLKNLENSDRANLKRPCVASLISFVETFPRPKGGWLPATEVAARVGLCQDDQHKPAFVLSGRYDLTLGSPEPAGEGHSRAGKVIIDLKTGNRNEGHAAELHLYALIETIKTGVPPLGVGSFYVAEGAVQFEPITNETLTTIVKRTTEGIRRLIELTPGTREPTRTPCQRCRWCPIKDCEPGETWRKQQATSTTSDDDESV